MKILLPFLLLISPVSNLIDTPRLIFHNMTDMPTARGAITTTSDGKCIYVSNGFSATSKFTGLIEKYDVFRKEWSVLTKSLIPKQFASSAVIDNNLYVFNGDLSDKTMNNKMEVVDLNSGAVSYSTDNPQPVHAGGVATWNNKIYFFGGKIAHEPSVYSDKLFEFDPATKKWTELASMPEKKETKGVAINGKIYTIGGYNGKVSTSINVYDIVYNKWTKLTDLPTGTSANAVVGYGSKVFTLFDYSNPTLIGCYDITSNKFRMYNEKHMIGRRHAGAHVLNNKLYIVGGNTSEAMNSCLSSLQEADIE